MDILELISMVYELLQNNSVDGLSRIQMTQQKSVNLKTNQQKLFSLKNREKRLWGKKRIKPQGSVGIEKGEGGRKKTLVKERGLKK